MRPEIHWLLHFCLENQLLTEGQVLGMVANLAPSTDVHACAKLLASSGWIADTAFLDSAIEAAIKNTQDGFELPVVPGLSSAGSQSNIEGFPDFSTFNQLNEDELGAAIRSLFTQCQKIGASDLHLTGGARPRMRHHRRIVYLSNAPLTDALARRINYLPTRDACRCCAPAAAVYFCGARRCGYCMDGAASAERESIGVQEDVWL